MPHGKDSYLSVDGTEISSYTDNTSHDQSQETAEVTAYGDDDKEFIAGLKSGTFALNGHWEAAQAAVLSGCFDGGTVTIIFGPDGNASGKVRYTCAALVTGYQEQAPVGDKVAWSANFQRSGALTKDTF
jgi:hypothetical protein